jgi:hypothetical protein
MPSRRAPWWMFIVAVSFLMYVSLVLYQTFWQPNVPAGQSTGFDFTFAGGRGMLVVAGRWAGLQPGDWNAILADTEVGRPQRWEIARDDCRGEKRSIPACLAWRSALDSTDQQVRS